MTWWNPLTWDMTAVAQTVVSAGLGTAVVSGIITMVRNYRHRKDLGAYMGIRLAVNLESYALRCANFCGENREAPHLPDEEFPYWNTSLPTLETYPEDAEGWRVLERRLAAQCLNLPNEIAGAQGMIRSTAEYNTEDLGDELELRAATLGLKSWNLACALRGRYGFKKAELDWDFPEMLELSINDAKSAIEKRRQSSAGAIDLD
ncbi:MAG TPA: hypothetical protein VMH84_13615 [Xanthobacteraceae bacterium]|nr:hypothetical protein [Xanthobacteraceae bacterium]